MTTTQPGVRPPRGGSHPTIASAALLVGAGAAVALSAVTGNSWLMLVAGATGGLWLTATRRTVRPDAMDIHFYGLPRVPHGGTVHRQLTITNTSRTAAAPIRILAHYPGLGEVTVRIPSLTTGTSATADVTWTAHHRGHHRSGSLRIEITDPLGLVTRVYDRAMTSLTVHPAPAAPLPAVFSRGNPGHGYSQHHGGSTDIAGLREWRTGDDRRAVQWRATARRGRMVVADRDTPESRRWVLAIVGTPSSPVDELGLARAMATWLDVRRGHIPASVLAWSTATTATIPLLLPAPDGPTEAILDWCAGIADLGWPTPTALLDALPVGCDAVTVLASSTTSARWWEELTAAAHQLGIEIVSATS
jgi:uncharacterized protein (DUF58 family)